MTRTRRVSTLPVSCGLFFFSPGAPPRAKCSSGLRTPSFRQGLTFIRAIFGACRLALLPPGLPPVEASNRDLFRRPDETHQLRLLPFCGDRLSLPRELPACSSRAAIDNDFLFLRCVELSLFLLIVSFKINAESLTINGAFLVGSVSQTLSFQPEVTISLEPGFSLARLEEKVQFSPPEIFPRSETQRWKTVIPPLRFLPFSLCPKLWFSKEYPLLEVKVNLGRLRQVRKM